MDSSGFSPHRFMLSMKRDNFIFQFEYFYLFFLSYCSGQNFQTMMNSSGKSSDPCSPDFMGKFFILSPLSIMCFVLSMGFLFINTLPHVEEILLYS